jgi:hypothetical protein
VSALDRVAPMAQDLLFCVTRSPHVAFSVLFPFASLFADDPVNLMAAKSESRPEMREDKPLRSLRFFRYNDGPSFPALVDGKRGLELVKSPAF